MNGREIPGYYFDTTKNKYFKIQANHIAPQGSQYSKQNVKKIREQERQEREHHLHSEAVRLQRVKRSAILQSPWAGLRLDCERQCDAGRRCETGITMFGAGLRHAYRLAMVNGVITACMDVEDSGGWLIGSYGYEGEQAVPRLGFVDRSGYWMFQTAEASHQCIETISIIGERWVTMTVGGDGTTHQMIAYLPSQATLDPEERSGPLTHFGFDADDVVLCSTANECQGAGKLVVHGMVGGARIYWFGQGGPREQRIEVDSYFSDVLAADWLDQHTAILGHRNGSVQLFDIRSRDSSLRLKHPSSINRVKRIDPNKLVVAGIENNTAMYDLRMPALSAIPARKRKRQGFTSEPVVRYDLPLGSNRLTRSLGFDLSASTGILAAADAENHINIFSLNHGSLLSRFQPDGVDSSSLPIRHVMLGKEPRSDALNFTCGNSLWRTTWGHDPWVETDWEK